ncbi:MAG: phage terminase large subunit family protein, partial [Alphaproteobacteria bacterium]|nr:phage terminase large subunit family protein [Alphaproteobacteria bacterium]
IPSANRAIKRGLSNLRAMPPMRLSQWAAEYFYLSAESSYTEGRWQAYPYQIAILDAFGNDDIEGVAVKKAARTGYTKMLMAAMAYFAVFRRRNQALWQPTDSDAQEFVETELNPMLRDVKPIKAIFPALGKKHQHNTNAYKKFLGCLMYIKGGSSARNYRRISVDVTILDEVDSFDKDIDKEGSPRKLAKKRTEGATFPKHIVGSTPKLKYLSEIDAAVQEADAVYQYHVPCPHCETEQPLSFGSKNSKHGLKWFNQDHETAAYACSACASLFTQADYLKNWQKGRWKDEKGNWYCNGTGTFKNAQGEAIRPPRHIAFDNLWTIYSPQASWSAIVREYRGAAGKAKHGERSDIKTFINTTLGQVYEDNVEKTDADELKKRAEDFKLQSVPLGGLILLAGVDVQKDRFELVVWALGRDEEMWTVDYQIIEANPSIQSEWDKLDRFLLHEYPHAGGAMLGIEHAAIDTGGHWTHQSYNHVRQRKSASGWPSHPQYAPRLYATKGSSTPNLTISGRASLQDVNSIDKVIRRGVKLYTIGTDTAKDLIHGRLQARRHGPGFVHLSKHLPDGFFEQLTNEVRILKQTSKGTVSSWVLKRAGVRNEVLDCTVMTLFCAHKIALHRKTRAEWQVMESIVQPSQHDLFAPPSSAAPPRMNGPLPDIIPPGELVRHSTGIDLSNWGRK